MLHVRGPVPDARAIRISRPSSAAPLGVPSAPPPGATRASPPSRRLENTAASRWAMRLGLLYALAVMAGYYLFLVLGEAAPGGRSAAELDDLAVLGILAALIAAAGFAVILRGAPRAIELRPDGWIVLERFGGSRYYPTSREFRFRRKRTFRGGLAPAPVASVQIGSGPVLRTYWIDESLLEELGAPVGA